MHDGSEAAQQRIAPCASPAKVMARPQQLVAQVVLRWHGRACSEVGGWTGIEWRTPVDVVRRANSMVTTMISTATSKIRTTQHLPRLPASAAAATHADEAAGPSFRATHEH